MLTYRLTGTTEQIGITTTNPTSLRPNQHRQQEKPTPNLRTTVRPEDGARLLTWKIADLLRGHYQPNQYGELGRWLDV
jgi:hypothetical protein